MRKAPSERVLHFCNNGSTIRMKPKPLALLSSKLDRGGFFSIEGRYPEC